jgi:multicomponent Na+:H+ antiporter subunit E
MGYIVLAFSERPAESRRYATRIRKIAWLAIFFAWELIRANLRVAHDVMTPTHYMKPGIVAIPLEAQTDLEITVLGALLSLTPGSLTLDVSSDRKVLYVHSMYIDRGDLDAYRSAIKNGFERKVLEALR